MRLSALTEPESRAEFPEPAKVTEQKIIESGCLRKTARPFWQNAGRSRMTLNRETPQVMPRLLALTLLMPLFANAAGEAVPIEQEPRHRLKFANEYVRFFDVELEPGYESRYHWHRN